MRLKKQRSTRPTRSHASDRGLECLETRQLLTGGPLSYFVPSVYPAFPSSANLSVSSLNLPIGTGPGVNATMDLGNKVVTGVDRSGDQWILQLHGPGSITVSDTTPNDGVLDDQLNTIQLTGTNPQTSYLTGQVIPSARVATDGTITFQHLIDLNGIKSISLNGFVLVPSTTSPAIYLPKGVGSLYFHEIDNSSDIGTNYVPIILQFGNSTTPLKTAPSVRVDTIQNTVFDSTTTTAPTGPQINPTVEVEVNGTLKNFNVVSVTSQLVQPAFQFEFPLVGVTGRTAVRALSVGHLRVVGAANNLTVSRSTFPFENGFSGVKSIKSAVFGGPADAVGIDSNGPIGRLAFLHGLGNPAGVAVSPSQYGTPPGKTGYPADGLLGGFVYASHIGRLTVGPNSLVSRYSQDPNLIQSGRHGYITYSTYPGAALTNALIVSQGSIGKSTIVGTSLQSEIKSGFNYQSFLAGLSGSRTPSHIGPIRYRGNLVNSVVSATYRVAGRAYGVPGDHRGPGSISGTFTGIRYYSGLPTPLNRLGAGFYARHKSPQLK